MMKNMKKLCWAILVVALTGLALQAEEKKDDGAQKGAAAEAGGKKGRGGGNAAAGKIFARFDQDGDGALSLKEFADARILDDASKREVAEIFQKRDLNSEGQIGSHEFAKTMDQGMGHHGHEKGRPGKGKAKGPGKGGKGGKE